MTSGGHDGLGADLSVAGGLGGLYLLEVEGSAPVRFVVE